MVKKLFKHEYLAWLRLLPLIYGITLVVAAMLRLLMVFETDSVYYDIVLFSAAFMYVVAVMVTLATPTVYGILRFYKNLFSGEGYLTHTLPVTPAAHIWVKLLTALSFTVASGLVCLLSGMIVTSGELFSEICKAISYLLGNIPPDAIPHLSGWLAESILLSLLSILNVHLLYSLCICLGQRARKNRVLAAVGVYFGFYMVSQILSTVMMVVITILGESGALDKLLTWIESDPVTFIHLLLIGLCLLVILVNIVYYLVCHWTIRKKLNLE